MNFEFKKTLIGLFVIAVLIFALGMLLFRTILAPHYFNVFPFLVLAFFIINALFFFSFFRSMKKSDAQFIRYFMASTAIKTILYLVIILVYVLVFPQYAIPFSITLLLLYFIFTAYDLLIMVKLLKRKREKKPSTNQLSN